MPRNGQMGMRRAGLACRVRYTGEFFRHHRNDFHQRLSLDGDASCHGSCGCCQKYVITPVLGQERLAGLDARLGEGVKMLWRSGLAWGHALR